MQLTLQNNNDVITIRRYDDGEIVIGETSYTHTIVLSRTDVIDQSAVKSVEDLTPGIGRSLLDTTPEVVLIGTGRAHRFPEPSFLGEILKTGTGCEVMTTSAACRTHNVLASEGRQVVTLLIVSA